MSGLRDQELKQNTDQDLHAEAIAQSGSQDSVKISLILLMKNIL